MKKAAVLFLTLFFLACTKSGTVPPQAASDTVPDTAAASDGVRNGQQDFIQLTLKDMGKVRDLTPKEFALFSCLNRNYVRLGNDLRDHSPFYYSYDTLIKIGDFVEQEAGHFYKESAPVYSENTPPPYTVIFSRCLAFSESEKLDRFLKSISPKKCGFKSEDPDCPYYNAE